MRVVALHCYPVKGCAPVTASAARIEPAGITGDRSFMVTDPDGVFRTQRADPLLATIRPAFRADGAVLALAAPGTGPHTVAVDVEGPRRAVDLFGNPFTGIDQGDAVAAWLTGVLGRPSRLVRAPPEHERATDGRPPGTSGYADSSAVHLMSTASLAALNRRVDGPPLPIARFRPNIVVDGCPAHAEDALRRVVIGTVELGYTKLAVRCAVTLVDQDEGRRAGPEPLRTLARYRRADTGGVVLGVKFAVVRPGCLAVGDEVLSAMTCGVSGPWP